MESSHKLKEIDINNLMCYYFDHIIKIEDFDINNILIDEKPYKNILVYNISYKSLIDSKPGRIRSDKIEGLIRVYDGARHLVLFISENNDYICNRICYLISVKSGITGIISHNYAKIKLNSCNFLPLVKTMTIHNVIVLIKSVWNKGKNNYYCNKLLEKASYELPKKYVFV